jgi:hypothetical protein
LRRLSADQRGDQLQRLERSMLRLERSNLQTLALLQQLVAAVKKPGDEGLQMKIMTDEHRPRPIPGWAR